MLATPEPAVPPRVWLLVGDKLGDNAQAVALADAIGWPYEVRQVFPKPEWVLGKPHFEPGIWRPPGGGVKPGEDFEAGVQREALEETGLGVELERYLVAAEARFLYEPYDVPWRTHVFLASTTGDALEPQDHEEIAAARWGTLAELDGTLRERLLATGRGFWRYRVALHDAALEKIEQLG